MALISCPQCGKQISDKSVKCINCGTALAICPKCGERYRKDDACTKCGYSSKPASTNSASSGDHTGNKVNVTTEQVTEDLFEKWLDDPRSEGYKVKKHTRILILSFVLSNIFVLVFYIILCFLQREIDAHNAPGAIDNRIYYRTLRTYYIAVFSLYSAFCIFDIVWCFFLVYAFVFRRFSCAAWLKANNLDGVASLYMLNKRKRSELLSRELFTWQERRRTRKHIRYLRSATYISKKGNGRRWHIAHIVLWLIGVIAAHIGVWWIPEFGFPRWVTALCITGLILGLTIALTLVVIRIVIYVKERNWCKNAMLEYAKNL